MSDIFDLCKSTCKRNFKKHTRFTCKCSWITVFIRSEMHAVKIHVQKAVKYDVTNK